jgi:hypothetical protein
VPIALIGRGLQLWPAFVDRVAASAFIDAGNAFCTDAQFEIYGTICSDAEMLLSAGAEVFSDVAILSFVPAWTRAGAALPLQGPRSSVRFYFTLGRSF